VTARRTLAQESQGDTRTVAAWVGAHRRVASPADWWPHTVTSRRLLQRLAFAYAVLLLGAADRSGAGAAAAWAAVAGSVVLYVVLRWPTMEAFGEAALGVLGLLLVALVGADLAQDRTWWPALTTALLVATLRWWLRERATMRRRDDEQAWRSAVLAELSRLSEAPTSTVASSATQFADPSATATVLPRQRPTAPVLLHRPAGRHRRRGETEPASHRAA
jgi:hypothetical protein